MLVTLIVILAGLIIGVVAMAAAKDSRFKVKRSIEIEAPAQTVFAQINDFHKWAAWSPWEKIDPTMQKTMTGAPSGEGAVYDWTGTGKAGSGRMTLQRSEPPNRIIIKLEFFKPFKAVNETEFNLVQHENGGAHVTWSMEGEASLMQRIIGIFMNMDKMVGDDFHKGLVELKRVSEARPA